MDEAELDSRTFRLLAGINKSARYHARRRMFYENWNAITTAMSAAVLAAGSILQVYATTSRYWALLLGAGAVWCAVDAALTTSKKAGLHNELAGQFAQIEKRFASGENLKDQDFEDIRKSRLDIETREPPTLYLLNELCTIAFERSVGVKPPPVHVPKWRMLLVHFLSQEEYTIKAFGEVNGSGDESNAQETSAADSLS